MNKRLMQFISDLAEENDTLHSKLECKELHIQSLHEIIKDAKAEIAELKRKLRAKKNDLR